MRVSGAVPLPELPDPQLDGDLASALDVGEPFLSIERLRLRVSFGGAFNYDVVTRRAMDAVVIAAHFWEGGQLCVMLRSAIRPPIWWRNRHLSALRAVVPPAADPQASALRAVVPPAADPQSSALRAVVPPAADPQASAWLWELPAGLVEPGEAFRTAAARELLEEIGADVQPADLLTLGPPMLPAPGMVAELQQFFHVSINPRSLTKPQGDSSALEEAGRLCALPISEALTLCASGDIRDLKTEVALRRLREIFP